MVHRRTFLKQIAITPFLFSNAQLLLAPLETKKDVVFYNLDHPDFAKVITTWNKRIKKEPAILALCNTPAGVQLALRQAREKKYKVTIKSGGHCFEGFCLNDGGMVVDVSPMKTLSMDAQHQVSAGAGNTVASLYDFIIPKNRFIASGSCGSVGLGGITLGGGYGFCSRQYGLTCDHLAEVQMVTAQGELVSSKQDPELLWACKGGGKGNFGVITKMIYKTHPAPTQFTSFRLRYLDVPPQRAAALLEQWMEACKKLSLATFASFGFVRNNIGMLVTNTSNDPKSDTKDFRDIFRASADEYREKKPDPLLNGLKRYYGSGSPTTIKNISGGYYSGFSEVKPFFTQVYETISKLSDMGFKINTQGGKINTPAHKTASAFPHRDKFFLGHLSSHIRNKEQEKEILEIIETTKTLLAKSGVTAHYNNYPDRNFKNWEDYYYKDHYPRLQALKKRLDPTNMFEHPQSVRLPGSS